MARGKSAPLTILQANLNHARRAQDLFLHTMAERGCWLGVASEPYASWFPCGCLGRAVPLVAIVRGVTKGRLPAGWGPGAGIL